MRLLFVPAMLAACAGIASAAPANPPTAPALPMDAFNNTIVKPLTLDEALNGGKKTTASPKVNADVQLAAATCAAPRVRKEFNNATPAERNAYIAAVKCLLGKAPSGQFAQAKNRYEDFVALHQTLTPNVHGNAKFLLWHRYYLWTFENVLQTECGYAGNLIWFDETKYSGHFIDSPVFSNDYYGGIVLGGNCVTNGQFANLVLNVGPGSGNTRHCLARNGDGSKTANTNAQMVNACNARTDYADMAGCAEGGAHAWGHNGIGAVMSDVYASPGDPVFFLHHAFVDRNYRIWQNADPNRLGYVDGVDHFGAALTLQTTVSVNNIRPNKVIGDILNTLGDTLCYKYDY